MLFSKVRVMRTELSSHVEAVAPWEVAVLQVIYPSEAVVKLGEIDEPGRAVPTAEDEMNRLISHYGMDNESGIPFAVQAFGMGQMGLRALEREIKAAVSKPAKAGVDALTA